MPYILKINNPGCPVGYYNENSTSLYVDKKKDAQRYTLRRDAMIDRSGIYCSIEKVSK